MPINDHNNKWGSLKSDYLIYVQPHTVPLDFPNYSRVLISFWKELMAPKMICLKSIGDIGIVKWCHSRL